jgi:ABC-2 type transport system permease protein
MNIRASLLPAGTPRAAFWMIVLNESRVARRFPLGLLIGVALPTMLLVIIGSRPGYREPAKALGGISEFTAYVPVFLVMVIAAFAFYGLPIPLAVYRDQGVLRRLSVTPVPPSWVLAAQLVLNVSFTVFELILLLVVAMTSFGVVAPKSPAGLVLALPLSMAAVFAIGLWVSAIARLRTAGLLAALCFFPLMFLAGLFLPRGEMPGSLLDISNFTPLGAAVQAIQNALLNGFPPVVPLLVLLGYAAIFGALAVRLFRWE